MTLLSTLSSAVCLSLLLVAPASVSAHGNLGHSLAALPEDRAHALHHSVGLAFGLTALAAGACIIGSTLPFLDVLLGRLLGRRQIDFATNPPFLSSMIAFSAGMMLYLALGDLFPVAVMGWESHFADNDNWKRAAGTISVGILAAAILVIYLAKHLVRTLRQKHDASMFAAVVGLHAVASNDFQKAALSATAAKQSASANDDGAAADGSDHSAVTNADTPATGDVRALESGEAASDKLAGHAVFRRLGMQISLALILHNFPEGLAMFAAAMVSSRTGTIFGIALALHKIPEGIMISLPIAVATGSRWKGFLASAIIGTLAQFLGALLGYFLLRTRWTGAVSGSLFSIVTGMLLYTVVGNMLPLARQLDQQDRYVTIWTLTGVVVFALINSVFSFS